MEYDLNKKLSDHFTLGEMVYSRTAEKHGIDNWPGPGDPVDETEMVRNLTGLCYNVLEPIRTHFGIPFSPNSGYRSDALNAKIRGSSKKSAHRFGLAADVELRGIDNMELARWCAENLPNWDQIILENVKRGVIGSGWVHVGHRRPRSGEQRGQMLTWIRGRGYSHGFSYSGDG